MIINEKELQTCLLFILDPFLKDNQIKIKEAFLSIHEKVLVDAKVTYNHYEMNIHCSFIPQYKNNCIILDNIEGQVDYLILSLDILQVIKQLIHDEHMSIHDRRFIYSISLPIEKITLDHQSINIEIKTLTKSLS